MTLPGIDLPAAAVEKRRSIPLQVLAEGTALSDFLAILEWAIGLIIDAGRGHDAFLSAAPALGRD